jgi:hypothetical protein
MTKKRSDNDERQAATQKCISEFRNIALERERERELERYPVVLILTAERDCVEATIVIFGTTKNEL